MIDESDGTQQACTCHYIGLHTPTERERERERERKTETEKERMSDLATWEHTAMQPVTSSRQTTNALHPPFHYQTTYQRYQHQQAASLIRARQ